MTGNTRTDDNTAIEKILAITTAASSSLQVSEIFTIIVNKVAEAMDAIDCSIVLLEKGGEAGTVLESFKELPTENLKLDLEKYPELKKVLETRKPLSVPDISNHPLMRGVQSSVKGLSKISALIIPIVFDDPSLGTIFLRVKRADREFNDNEANLCRLVAEASFFSLKNANRFEELKKEKEKLKEISISDPLTGIYNHNYFYQRLEEEFGRASRYGMPLSVVMMDIDNFKKINDTFGHRVGDKVLKKIANILKKSVRKSDLIARYGGEEFAEILTYTQKNGAAEEAERIRNLVSEITFTEENIELTVTLSLGVAEYHPDNTADSGELVNRADKALYQAKNAGKNCVKVA
ncbi:MAG: sensor domain-containing diguanylate cyclase [Proteobacteria bacterium]|nr:sensor domain-containing diguanylate cyclase [Pseudomonadota bacterium]